MYMNDRIVMDVFNPIGVYLSEQSVVMWCYYPQRVSVSAIVTWYGNSLCFVGRCINMSAERERGPKHKLTDRKEIFERPEQF